MTIAESKNAYEGFCGFGFSGLPGLTTGGEGFGGGFCGFFCADAATDSPRTAIIVIKKFLKTFISISILSSLLQRSREEGKCVHLFNKTHECHEHWPDKC